MLCCASVQCVCAPFVQVLDIQIILRSSQGVLSWQRLADQHRAQTLHNCIRLLSVAQRSHGDVSAWRIISEVGSRGR